MLNASSSNLFVLLFLASLSLIFQKEARAQDTLETIEYVVLPGDSWVSLAWRYNLSEQELQAINPHPNLQRLPSIGSSVTIPLGETQEKTGRLRRSDDGGLLQSAVIMGADIWELAFSNQLGNPYRPQFYRPIFYPEGAAIPKDLPFNISELELSSIPAIPGQALALRAAADKSAIFTAYIGSEPMSIFQSGKHIIALGGTGAFYPPGDLELVIQQPDAPLWSQPWHMHSGAWTFEEIYLTGDAAAIDQEMIRQERERLQSIWSETSPEPLWSGPFQMPLHEYLGFSSLYGARRSYNGGPYRSYHEGLDFSAFGGTVVSAPAAGRVVLSEFLDVRGGAVIIDHGLGLYSGFYHMSEILVAPGEAVGTNQEIGKVGSTGLSTGNHLHWDLLINNTWIDPGEWLKSDRACWLLEGFGQPCQ